MSLCKIKVTGHDVVLDLGWANPAQRNIGDVTEDGFTIYDIAEFELDAYVPNHTKLLNGHLVVDPDYVPPKPPEPIPNPAVTTQAALAKQVAELTVTNAAIAKQVATIEQKINKGDK